MCIRDSFSAASTLLVGRQEEHLACKTWVVRCWHGCLSVARCKWFTYGYGPADATVTPSFLASVKCRLVQPFWCQFTQVVLEKGPLNGCLVCLCMLLSVLVLSLWNVSSDLLISYHTSEVVGSVLTTFSELLTHCLLRPTQPATQITSQWLEFNSNLSSISEVMVCLLSALRGPVIRECGYVCRRDGGGDSVSDGAWAVAGVSTQRPAADRELAAVLRLWHRLHASLRDRPLTSPRQITPHVRCCPLLLPYRYIFVRMKAPCGSWACKLLEVNDKFMKRQSKNMPYPFPARMS